MGPSTLIITIALSAIFGVALICIAIYFLHRYIHHECRKIRDFFTSVVWADQKQEDYARERGDGTLRHSTPEAWTREEERRKTSEWERAERDSEERKRQRETRRRDKTRRREEGWGDGDEVQMQEIGGSMAKTYRLTSSRRRAIGEGFEAGGGHGYVLQPYVPMYVPAFVPVLQPWGTHYLPAGLPALGVPLGGELGGRNEGQRVDYDVHPSQQYEDEFEEEAVLSVQADVGVDDPVELPEELENNGAVAAYEGSASEEPTPARTTPMIVICDEYPPLIREYNEKMESAREATSSSSSSSSSADEEVLRGPIPTAIQRSALRFPQVPWRTHPADIPRSYPSQW